MVTLGFCIFLCLVGVAAFIAGAVQFLRAKQREHRCTETVMGSVSCIEDESAKGGLLAKFKPKEKEETVVAANDAIAQKKQAYLAKKRAQAKSEAMAASATWRPYVQYTINGQKYEKPAVRLVPLKRLDVGTACMVHYDPKDPDYAWFGIDGLTKGMGVTLMLSGISLIAVSIISWLMVPYLSEM